MNRSERAILTANSTSPRLLFKAGDGSVCWRLVEAWSSKGLPWELLLSWTLGNGPGTEARISISSAARVCVFAQDIKLDGLNRSSSENPVGLAVVNGFMPTANVFDLWATCDGTNPVTFQVPPFAQRFDLQLGNRHLLSSTSVTLTNGSGANIVLPGEAIPAAGLAIGSVDLIQVLTPVSCQLRAIFSLGL